jgi:hypothetical protein
MKPFSQFLSESKVSLAAFNAKRLGLIRKNGSDFYRQNPRTGDLEFQAKAKRLPSGQVGLKFYNQNEIPNEKDPRQNRNIVNPKVPKSQQTNEEHQNDLRERYIRGEIFNEGEWVQSIINEKVGKIIRKGTNYLICVTEDETMFKSWITDVIEWTEVSGVPADQREVGTDEFRKYAMKMTGTKDIKNFINKYKVKQK